MYPSNSTILANCRSKVRSSYSSKVESSCFEPANCRDEPTGDAGAEYERSGSIESIARGQARAFDAAAGRRAAGDQRSLGQIAAAAGEEGGRPGCSPPPARTDLESASVGEGPPEGAEAGGSPLPRLWAHAGLRVLGQEPRGGGEQGDAAAVADGGRAVARPAPEGGGGAPMAAAAELVRGAGAVGHLATRLAGRARPPAVPSGHDR